MPKFINPLVTGPGTGTVLDPFKAPSSAGFSWSADDIFLGMEGTTSTEVFNPTVGGTAGQRKVIGTYQAQTGHQLTGPGVNRHRIDASAMARGVYLGATKNYVDVMDIEILGGEATDYGIQKDLTGTDPATTSDCRFFRVKITDMIKPGGAVALRAYGANTVVQDCEIDTVIGDGFYLLGNGLRIIGNTTRNTSAGGSEVGDAIQLVGACADFLVMGNDCEQLNNAKQCLNTNDAGAYGSVIGNRFVMNFPEAGSPEFRPISIAGGVTNIVRNALIGGTAAVFLVADNSTVERNHIICKGAGVITAAVLKGDNCVGRFNTIQGNGYGTGMNNSGVAGIDGVTMYGNVIGGFAKGIQLYNDGVEYGNQLFNCGIPVANSADVAQALGVGTTYSATPLPESGLPAEFQFAEHIGYMLDRNGRLYPNPPPCGAYSRR